MTGSRAKALVIAALAIAMVLLAACSSSDTDQQVAELERQVEELQAQLDQTQAALDEANSKNAELEQQLTDAQAQLTETEQQLGTTQAELLDAQAQLAKVGELKLADGTYVGQVLGAKASPYRVIVFNAGGLFRAAQVASDVTITAGGSELTLSQFGRLLSSTSPDDAKLANGNYQVIVKEGLVTSIRKSKK